MDFLLESLQTSWVLISTLDRDVYLTVWTSLYTSAVAILIASVVGVPVGMGLALNNFYGKRLVITLLNTLLALPTVVIGLMVFALVSRHGLFGEFGLMFTPTAMIIGQVILATPIVATITVTALTAADERIIPTAKTLGAGSFQAGWQLFLEARYGIIAALVAGFGRIISEVGVAMMLGGNIRGYTRTMTTAIALETNKGEFGFGLALGLILMMMALSVNLLLNLLQHR